MTNKILSFCLGEEDGTAIFCETREEFLQYINEKIDEAEERGQEHFDMTIEKTDCLYNLIYYNLIYYPELSGLRAERKYYEY